MSNGCLEDIAAYLTAEVPELQAGSNLFVHTMPEDPAGTHEMAMLMFEPAAADVMPTRTYGATVPVSMDPILVVVVRSAVSTAATEHPDPRPAERIAHRIWEVLERTANTYVPSSTGTFVFAAEANVPPIYAGRDERMRAGIEQRFSLSYTPSTWA